MWQHGRRRSGTPNLPDEVRWIRSYVVVEDDGTLGSICIHQASSPQALRAHADRVGMPADTIVTVADLVVTRPDRRPAQPARSLDV